MKTIYFFLLSSLLALGFCACKKDDDPVNQPPPVDNEPEVITTVKLIFTDSADATVRTATFRDPDGDGGATYDIFDTIRLIPNRTWFTRVLLLNETVSPADTLSNEVLDEGVDHLICFNPSGIAINVVKTDLDNNGLPIGLQTTWYTTNAAQGLMQVVLKHQPGIKTGDCAPGDTDVEVNFPVKVE